MRKKTTAWMIWIDDMLDRVSAAAPAVVLVVEDEPLLRELAVEFIEDAGFLALEAGDAEEAVALLEARSDIAVVFTDINMPGNMDGLKLAHMVRDRWPTKKIVVASGRVRLAFFSKSLIAARRWWHACVRWSVRPDFNSDP